MMRQLSCFMMIILITLATASKETGDNMDTANQLVIDFKEPPAATWRAINDGVMGGLSQSDLAITGDGTGVFAGNLSLENSGGFASVRTSLGEIDLSEFDGLAVRVAGDGKRYRLRLRTDNRFDGIAYQAIFDTTNEDWQTVEIPFETFVPTYRGRTLRDVPPLDRAKICQLGFMIADKQEGRFRLEIALIHAYKKRPEQKHDRTP